MKKSTEEVKCVVIGDGAVGIKIEIIKNFNKKKKKGKTSMIHSFYLDIFPEPYCPTVFDNCENPPKYLKLDGN